MDIKSQGQKLSQPEDTIIRFEQGLIGFEQYQSYRLLSSEQEASLHWLQPVDEPAIDFAVTFPQVFDVDFEITLSDEESRALAFNDGDEIIVLVMLSRRDQLETSGSALKANFMAPVLINPNSHKGLQKILNNRDHPVTITMKG